MFYVYAVFDMPPNPEEGNAVKISIHKFKTEALAAIDEYIYDDAGLLDTYGGHFQIVERQEE